MSSPTTSRYVPPSRSTSVRCRSSACVAAGVRPSCERTWTADQVALGALRHPRRAPDEPVAVLCTGEGDEHALARLPRLLDAVEAPVLVERLVDPVGHPEERELAQRAEVPGPEVVAERGVDALRRIDVPVGHPAPERLRRHVDELDLVGAPDDLVRDRLLLVDPGDPLDDVVERLEVLDVQGRDHGDAGLEQLVDVLPALLVARARDVRVRELVDERDLRLTREDRVDVHLLERRPILDGASRDDLEVADLLGGLLAAVRLDEARRRRRCRARGGGDPRSSIANVLPTPGAAPR